MSELLTPKEAADELHISTRQVHRLIGKGPEKLQAVRIGTRSIRIYRTSIETMLRNGAMNAGC